MNWGFQRKLAKPKAKSCNWCKHFNDNFECEINGMKNGITRRLFLKFNQGFWDFRYCKHYRYSRLKFKSYKNMCEENAKATGYIGP